MGATTIDEAKIDQFAGKAVGQMGRPIPAPPMVSGEKLGVYRGMAGAGPLTAQVRAERAGSAELVLEVRHQRT